MACFCEEGTLVSRTLIAINDDRDRERAVLWARRAPRGMRIIFQTGGTRTLEQNARMWAMLAEIAKQVEWHSLKLSDHDWKDMFTAALRKARVVPSLDGNSFVVLGQHTSEMSVREMAELIELMLAFGAERGVVFRDPRFDDYPQLEDQR
jgi:hypothetical protein